MIKIAEDLSSAPLPFFNFSNDSGPGALLQYFRPST